jgi:hypothetical protein
LARLAVGGTWGSMRQAEINAAACGSNGTSGAPPPLILKNQTGKKIEVNIFVNGISQPKLNPD